MCVYLFLFHCELVSPGSRMWNKTRKLREYDRAFFLLGWVAKSDSILKYEMDWDSLRFCPSFNQMAAWYLCGCRIVNGVEGKEWLVVTCLGSDIDLNSALFWDGLTGWMGRHELRYEIAVEIIGDGFAGYGWVTRYGSPHPNSRHLQTNAGSLRKAWTWHIYRVLHNPYPPFILGECLIFNQNIQISMN